MRPPRFFDFSNKAALEPVSGLNEEVTARSCKWNRETLNVSFVSDDAAQRVLKVLNSKTPRDPHLTKAGLFRSC